MASKPTTATCSEPSDDFSNNNGGARNNKLVLCFDGTGNKSTGGPADTNIVKIYQMLDREAPGQYHYYQPGIGTYTADEDQLTKTPWGAITRHISQALHEALGTTFGHHVIEGLLSCGNEEMIPFAWKTYADYERRRNDVDPKEESFMLKFKNTFCRHEVSIKFLGLFDTVNSVGSFEIPGMRRSFPYVACPPAEYIRHAVSIDERRAKFKPALFDHRTGDNILEMWFPGNHGDIGGGWEPKPEKELLNDVALAWMVSELHNLDVENPLQWKQQQLESHELEENSRLKAVNSDVHDALALNRGWGWFGTFGWWIIEVLPIFSRREQ
ncbi:hypothetical protein RUND412_006689, partial [Rhizina undulata]